MAAGGTPMLVVAKKDLPVKDFKEFVTYAKTNQKTMKFGSAGAGSATHLGCVLLNYVIGTDINERSRDLARNPGSWPSGKGEGR